MSFPPSQLLRAQVFSALHEQPGIFAIPNPWDAGSAKILSHLGFKALTTTSAGLAFSLGKEDGKGLVTRAETLDNIRAIVQATALPVAGDLENGFGDDPETCAETILMGAEAGLVGGSIEDATGRADHPIYEFEKAVERIKAAVAAARSLPFPFMLTARAENLIHGRPDLPDTIRRLQAYAGAGANVLFAPGLTAREEITAVVQAVAPHPVNVVLGLNSGQFSLAGLAEIGVKRVSIGSSLSRIAYGGLFRAAQELREQGTADYAMDAMGYGELNALFR